MHKGSVDGRLCLTMKEGVRGGRDVSLVMLQFFGFGLLFCRCNSRNYLASYDFFAFCY